MILVWFIIIGLVVLVLYLIYALLVFKSDNEELQMEVRILSNYIKNYKDTHINHDSKY